MSFVSLYLYVPDEGSLLPKYRDCTTSNDFESYIYIYIFKYGTAFVKCGAHDRFGNLAISII